MADPLHCLEFPNSMQLAVIEIARNVLKMKEANSTEFNKTNVPIISLMTEWIKNDKLEKRNINSDKGGAMRLGAYRANLKKGSKISTIYKSNVITERQFNIIGYCSFTII